MIILHSLFSPELSSGTWHEYFQRIDKIYFLIKIQIIRGLTIFLVSNLLQKK